MTKTQNPLKIATPPKNNLAKYKTKLDSVKNGQDRASTARRRVPPQASPSTKKFRCSATHPHFLVLGRPARFSPARPHSRLQSRLLSLHGQQRRGDCSGLAGGGRCERSAFSLPVFGLRRRWRRPRAALGCGRLVQSFWLLVMIQCCALSAASAENLFAGQLSHHSSS